MPPIAQWLLLRYRATWVIPSGLFIIGLGFFLMWGGSLLSHLGGWTVLPGALVAGIGWGDHGRPPQHDHRLGAAHRAGMASGMDVSARLITLVIHIAVMGLVLVGRHQGLAARAVGSRAGARAAAGAGPAAGGRRPGRRAAAAGRPCRCRRERCALAGGGDPGLRWVMLYGGLAAWITAVLSFAVLRERPGSTSCSCGSGMH